MLAVAVVVLGVVLLLQDDDGASAQRDEVRQVSEDFAVALTSYDYTDLKGGFARVRSMSTGAYQEEFDELLGGRQLTQALEASQAKSVATVTEGPYVATLSDDEARTVTVVEQEITNKQLQKPQTQRTRVQLFLVRLESGGWKVDRVSTS